MTNRLSSENPWDINPDTPIVNSVAAQMELARSRLESSLPSSSSTPHALSSAASLEEIPAADPWNAKPPQALPITNNGLEQGGLNLIQNDSKQPDFKEMDSKVYMDANTIPSTFPSMTVTILPEKEGFFMKKHVKYSISCCTLNTNVKRRYSDFMWLYEVLSKRYPFRVVPNIPPKRMNLDNHQLELRRRGLVRFLNNLQSHPFLFKDPVVVDFLSTRIEIQDYKYQHDVSLEETVPESLDDIGQSLPLDMDSKFHQFETALVLSIQKNQELAGIFTNLLTDSNSQFKSWGGMARQMMAIGNLNDCIFDSCFKGCDVLGDQFRVLSSHFLNISLVYSQQNQVLCNELNERLVQRLELLLAFRQLLQRRERVLSDMSIESIQKRTEQTRAQISDLTRKPSAEKEVERLSSLLHQEQEQLKWLESRRQYWNSCLWEEMRWYHYGKLDLHLIFQEFLDSYSLDFQRILNIFRGMNDEYRQNTPMYN